MSLSSTCPIMGSLSAFISVILMVMVLKYLTSFPEINGRATTKSFPAKAGPRGSSLALGTRSWPHRWPQPGSSETDTEEEHGAPLSAFMRGQAGHDL